MVPGVNSPSQVEQGLERGLTLLKFFPAEASGGVKMLKALHGPYAEVSFMPTGGVDPSNLGSYLALSYVAAVGGSWMVKDELMAGGALGRDLRPLRRGGPAGGVAPDQEVRGALLLDLDGVLFDSEPVHQRAWERALADLGVMLPQGWYEPLAGQSLLDVARAVSHRHAPWHPPAALATRKRATYQQLAAGLPPSPGVLEVLVELRPRAALVSSSGRDDVQVLLRDSGLPAHLETLVTGDDVPAPKPDPAGYLLALARLDLPAGRCVAVEDSISGVRAAGAAGLRVVAVAPGGEPPDGAFSWRSTAAEAIRLAAAILAP